MLVERVVERGRLGHALEHEVSLGVERHRRRGMAGDRLEELDVGPLGDQRRDRVVAQVVKAEGALETCEFEGAFELAPPKFRGFSGVPTDIVKTRSPSRSKRVRSLRAASDLRADSKSGTLLPRLRLCRLGDRSGVVRRVNAHEPRLEVHVCPAQRQKLATAKPREAATRRTSRASGRAVAMTCPTCSRLGGRIFRLRAGGTETRLAGLSERSPSSTACVKSAFSGMSMFRMV